MKPLLKINTELNNLLPKADEIWVAAATMSKYGLHQIQSKTKSTAKQNILVGIDLPTNPNVLSDLMQLHEKENIEAKLYFNKEKFYHPKVYIIKSGDKISAIVGSGNCTKGGLESNLEISLRTDDKAVCQELIKYFGIYFKLGDYITEDFIEKYKVIFERRSEREKEDRKEIKLIAKKDPNEFSLEEIDFKNQFFTHEHYSAFEGTKPFSHELEINEERYEVWKKLYELHELVEPVFRKNNWDLHPHHKLEYVVSSYSHSSWTSENLNSLWLHYGRNESELKKYKEIYGDNQSSMYHMRLQILIQNDSLNFWCRVGKNGGSLVDREYFKENMLDAEYRNKFFSLVKDLDDKYWILINDESRLIKEFSTSNELHDFTKKDKNRLYFIIGKSLRPDDIKLSRSNIVKTTEEEFGKLYPIYEHIKHKF